MIDFPFLMRVTRPPAFRMLERLKGRPLWRTVGVMYPTITNCMDPYLSDSDRFVQQTNGP